MLPTIFVILLAAAAGLALYISRQPDDFRYERSAAMNAAPATIFETVNDLRRWNDWSPWSKLDPNAKMHLEGPPSGEGSKFFWDGNNKVGAGNMTITESRPGELVKIRLEFLRPMKAVSTVDFTFKPTNDNLTLVTWSMYGPNTTMGKAISLVMDCKKMTEQSFDQGLSSLKSIVERR